MTNRNKITKFCKKHNIEIINLEYVKNRDLAYGDSWDSSYWELKCKINGEDEEFYSDKGDTVGEGVDVMLEEILEDLK